jgi:hypothetical protein
MPSNEEASFTCFGTEVSPARMMRNARGMVAQMPTVVNEYSCNDGPIQLTSGNPRAFRRGSMGPYPGLNSVAQIRALAVNGIMYGRYATKDMARFARLLLSTSMAKAVPIRTEKTAVPMEKKRVLYRTLGKSVSSKSLMYDAKSVLGADRLIEIRRGRRAKRMRYATAGM